MPNLAAGLYTARAAQRIRRPKKVRGPGVSRGLSTEGAVPGLHPNRVSILGSSALSRERERGSRHHML